MSNIFLATEHIQLSNDKTISYCTPFSTKELANIYIDHRQDAGDFTNSISFSEVPIDRMYVRISLTLDKLEFSVLPCFPHTELGKVYKEGDSYYLDMIWDCINYNSNQIIALGDLCIKEFIRMEKCEGIFYGVIKIEDDTKVIPFNDIYPTDLAAQDAILIHMKVYPNTRNLQIVSGRLTYSDEGICFLDLEVPLVLGEREISSIPIVSKSKL